MPSLVNQAHAIAFHETQLKAYRQGLTGPQQRAINEYANGDYKGINKYLRDGGSLDGNSAFAHASKHILASMQPLPERVPAYRGINGTLKAFQTPGALIQDKAFLSTSVDEGVATQFSKQSPRTIAAFYIPKGAKAAFANHRSHGDKNGEREIILPPGAKFKVLGRRRSAVFKTWIVDMEYVP